MHAEESKDAARDAITLARTELMEVRYSMENRRYFRRPVDLELMESAISTMGEYKC